MPPARTRPVAERWGVAMRTDVARAVGTVAIWAAVATVLTNLEVHAPPHMMVELMVGITAFLATGAAFGTCAIWRSPRAGRPAEGDQREL